MPKDPWLFKNHHLPIDKDKKIMKREDDVRVYFLPNDIFINTSSYCKSLLTFYNRT